MRLDEIWNAVLGSIELSISKAQFGTWFKGTQILSLEKDCVFIRVPNGFAKEWLENKFNIIILKSLHELGYSVKEIRCKVEDPPSSKEKAFAEEKRVETPFLKEKFLDHKNNHSYSHPRSKNTFSNLNPRYTFEDFIIGNHNELAYSACVAVYQDLGNAYNPLFIYGGVGLGKTHLLQSIGNAILKNAPEKKVLYITSEKFTQELINSIKNHTVDTFKNFYQNIDLLIIDDVQFLSGREKTQQEFFHIFNALYQQNKQIVLSSDRPPKAIATLEDRLRSRFEGGMIADINRPDLETRIAILQEKAQQKNLSLSEEIFSYIAQNITNNVRELEGALTRIMALQQFHHIHNPTIKDVESILKEIITSGQKKAISQEDIIHSVSSFYGISSQDLKQKGRKKEIAEARQMAMYLMRKELNLPYTGIGRCFSGRDHTTALHAFEKIEKLLDTDEKIKKDVLFLREKIYCIE